jgi:hypothetical protein
MAYSTPRTWVAGDVLTAAQLNQDVRDNVSFLANPPACRASHNAGQSVANATLTALALNIEIFDTDTMHDTVTNNSRVTFTTAGLYVIEGGFEMPNTGDYTVIAAMLRLNGATTIAANSMGTMATPNLNPVIGVSTIYKVTAAQYVELVAFHTNGPATARTVPGNSVYSPRLAATRIGIG